MKMDIKKLLTLNIIAMDMHFGRKDPRGYIMNKRRGNTDSGIFFIDDSGIGVVRIDNGISILKDELNTNFKALNYNSPVISKYKSEIVRCLLRDNEIREFKISADEFKQMAPEFIKQYVFERFESGILTLDDYLTNKENMGIPLSQKQEESMQCELTNEFTEMLYENPSIIGLPADPLSIHKEVRLHNRLAQCLSYDPDYRRFLEEGPFPNNHLTICDYVVRYLDETYVVELKVKYSNEGQLRMKCRPYRKGQLPKASKFFAYNFDTDPKLVVVMINASPNETTIGYNHYISLSDGSLIRNNGEWAALKLKRELILT